MIKRMYSVRDNIAEMFLDTFSSTNNKTAMRDFSAGVLDSPNKNDLVLYYVGDFDNHSGQLKHCEPQRLITGLEIQTKDDMSQVKIDKDGYPSLIKKQAI